VGHGHQYRSTVVIPCRPEGVSLVSVPALPGSYTERHTPEEDCAMAADAIRACCASSPKNIEPIPIRKTQGSQKTYVTPF
jgi:predicted RNase H-like HicB family nuclease